MSSCRTSQLREAWKDLSSEFNWNETMLEKYQGQRWTGYEEISRNRNILWTIQ